MNCKKLSLALVVMLGYVGFSYSISYKKALPNLTKAISKETAVTPALQKAYNDYVFALKRRLTEKRISSKVYTDTMKKRHDRISKKFGADAVRTLAGAVPVREEEVPPVGGIAWNDTWGDKPWYWDMVITRDNKDDLTNEEADQNLVEEKDKILRVEASPKKTAIEGRLKQLLTDIKNLEIAGTPSYQNADAWITELS